MKILSEILFGISASLFTAFLVIGALMLGIAEGSVPAVAIPSAAAVPTDPLATYFVGFTTPTSRPKSPSLVTVQPPSVATACPPPAGWEAYTVLPGDSLRQLAQVRLTTLEALIAANCLPGASVSANSLLYLPPAPTATATSLLASATFTPWPSPTLCRPPDGWVRYIVRSGDTLFQVANLYGISWPVLQKANCMGSSTFLRTGMVIFVPNTGPRFPTTSVPPATAFPTRPPATATGTMVVPSVTITRTPVPQSATPTRTAVAPSATLVPTASSTATLTPSPITPTPTPSHTVTPSPTGTKTAVLTSMPTASFTPEPSPTGK